MRCGSLLSCVVAVATALLVTGCETTEDRLAMAQVTHTPLAFDPTESSELDRWWTDGVRLLRLDPQGSYIVFPSRNRYRPPAERGRWSRRSYAELRFTPYEELRTESFRVAVAKRDGEIVLVLPREQVMWSMSQPPRAPEDDVLGPWVAARSGAIVQVLVLFEDLRYTWTRAPAPGHEPARVVGHEGVWTLDDDRLRLTPDTPRVEPMTLDVQRDPDAANPVIGLDSADGRFTRQGA